MPTVQALPSGREPAIGGDGILNHLPRLFGVGEIDRRDASHRTAGAMYELDRLVVDINLDVAPDNQPPALFSSPLVRAELVRTSPS